jgi:hypothetical protein
VTFSRELVLFIAYPLQPVVSVDFSFFVHRNKDFIYIEARRQPIHANVKKTPCYANATKNMAKKIA